MAFVLAQGPGMITLIAATMTYATETDARLVRPSMVYSHPCTPAFARRRPFVDLAQLIDIPCRI
jgi:hypothetical protein